MGGTESLLTDLLSSTDRDLGFLLTAIPCLRMSRTLRQKIGTVLRKSRTKSLIYAILLCNHIMLWDVCHAMSFHVIVMAWHGMFHVPSIFPIYIHISFRYPYDM